MADTPTTEPTVIVSGDSAEWIIDISDYRPGDGWTLTYFFVPLFEGGTSGSVDGSDNGDGRHLVELDGAFTGARSDGEWKWTAAVSDGTDRYTVRTGRMRFDPDPSTATDGRSHNKKVIDAITAVLENRADQSTLAEATGDRSTSFMSHQELVDLLEVYERRYADELRKEAAESGDPITYKVVF